MNWENVRGQVLKSVAKVIVLRKTSELIAKEIADLTYSRTLLPLKRIVRDEWSVFSTKAMSRYQQRRSASHH